MSTGSEFANLVSKRVLDNTDMKERFLDYLKAFVQALSIRTFDADGVFDQSMTMSSPADDEILIEQSPDEGFAGTDGNGNFLALGAGGSEDATVGQIKQFPIENTAAVEYYISLQVAERPFGIEINPRTALPDYDRLSECIGVKAEPNAVTDNGSNLTFTIDSVCEAGHDHAGRTALVFMKTPADGAITEAIAIESLTVTWNGSNNRITTSGLLGQSTPSTTPADYWVVLLGPSVRKTDTSGVAGHMYIGKATGTGSPGAVGPFDYANQGLIDQSLSSLLNYPGGPNWADGTTNPAATIVSQLDKIVNDLTSTTGGRGLAKLTSAARGNWFDGTTNPATDADTAIKKIITDLASTLGSSYIGSGSLPNWADATNIASDSVFNQLQAFVTVLAAAGGAGKVGFDPTALANTWSNGDAPLVGADDILAALDALVSDLRGSDGTDRVGFPGIVSNPDSLPGGTLLDGVTNLLADLNNRTKNAWADNLHSIDTTISPPVIENIHWEYREAGMNGGDLDCLIMTAVPSGTDKQLYITRPGTSDWRAYNHTNSVTDTPRLCWLGGRRYLIVSVDHSTRILISDWETPSISDDTFTGSPALFRRLKSNEVDSFTTCVVLGISTTGTLYRSTDSGKNWASVSGSLDSVASAANVWYDNIESRFYVTDNTARNIDYSDDDGATWTGLAGTRVPADWNYVYDIIFDSSTGLYYILGEDLTFRGLRVASSPNPLTTDFTEIGTALVRDAEDYYSGAEDLTGLFGTDGAGNMCIHMPYHLAFSFDAGVTWDVQYKMADVDYPHISGRAALQGVYWVRDLQRWFLGIERSGDPAFGIFWSGRANT